MKNAVSLMEKLMKNNSKAMEAKKEVQLCTLGAPAFIMEEPKFSSKGNPPAMLAIRGQGKSPMVMAIWP